MEHLNGTVVSTSVISTRKRNTTVAIAHVPGGAAVTVLLRKLTSAQDDGHVPGVLAQGVVHFYGIVLNTPGARLESSSSSSSKRRLEFFGASDTAGFGVDGYPDPGKLTCLTHPTLSSGRSRQARWRTSRFRSVSCRTASRAAWGTT